MISKSELKYFSSLAIKKFRDKENKFIAEGLKIVKEGLESNYDCKAIFVTEDFIESHHEFYQSAKIKNINIYQLDAIDFKKISDTKTPQGVAAVFNKSLPQKNIRNVDDKIIVLIDNVSDPGNLGTIIRTCDWFGIKNILISNQSVDYLNPKVVRASMGSIFHLNIWDNVIENDLILLKQNGYKVFSADLKGKNIFGIKRSDKSIFIFSNEATGPSETIRNITDEYITISGKGSAESLNVSTAAAIILSVVTNES